MPIPPWTWYVRLGIARIGTGDIQQTDRNYQDLGTFSRERYQVYLSYGLKLPWDLASGLSIKVNRSVWPGLTVTARQPESEWAWIWASCIADFQSVALSARLVAGLNLENLFPPQVAEGVRLTCCRWYSA